MLADVGIDIGMAVLWNLLSIETQLHYFIHRTKKSM